MKRIREGIRLSEQQTIRISDWDVPLNLFEDYVKFSTFVDQYLDGTLDMPSHTDYERRTRWLLCVQKIMEIHREICKIIGIPYSEDHNDVFYIEFHREAQRRKDEKKILEAEKP